MKAKLLILLISLLTLASSFALSGCVICEHQFIDEVVAPTCTQNGYMIHKCTLCSIIITDTYTPATGHVYSEESMVVAPTCTEQGYTYYECEQCGEREKSDFVAALGHDYAGNGEVIAPTCTEKGYTIYHCERCAEQVEAEHVAPLGHTYIDGGIVVEPTCTEQGYTNYQCERCGDAFVDNYVDALGHSYTVEQIIEEATCVEEGLKHWGCSRCDDYRSVVIPKSDHTYEEIDDVNGYSVKRCTCPDCDYEVKTLITYTITYDLGGGTADNPTEYTVESDTFSLKAPTNGDDTFLGWTWEGQDSPMLEVVITKGSWGYRNYVANWRRAACEGYHTLNGEFVTTDTLDSSTPGVTEFGNNKATCSTNGKGLYTCEVCENIIYIDTTKAHEADVDKVQTIIVEPTCEEPGTAQVSCKNCSELVESAIPALGHDYESEFVVVDQQAMIKSVCSRCGDTKDQVVEECSDYIPATCSTPGSAIYTYVDGNGETVLVEIQIPATDMHTLNGVPMGSGTGAVVPYDISGLVIFAGAEATCTKTGMALYICDCCDQRIFVTTYKPHTFDEDTLEVVQAPTCTESGIYKGHCSECNQTVEAEVPATGHDHGYKVKTSPTQTRVGVAEITCKVVGCEFKVSYFLPKLSYSGYVKTELGNGYTQYTLYLPEYDITIYLVG